MQPWKVKGWVIPPLKNGDFVANMERVLEIYKRPYDKDCPVVCMDESPKQLIKEYAYMPDGARFNGIKNILTDEQMAKIKEDDLLNDELQNPLIYSNAKVTTK